MFGVGVEGFYSIGDVLLRGTKGGPKEGGLNIGQREGSSM